MTAQPDDSTYQEARSSAPLDPDAPSHPLTQLRPDSDLGRQEYGGRNWGVSLALYALRSARSWGMGDFADLGDLAAIVAHVGGDYLVVGPVTSTTQQAVERLGFTCAHGGGLIVDPLHIRPEDIREVAYLPSSQRTMLDWGSETIRATNTQPDPINVDEVWEAKKAALEVAFSVPRTPARQALFHQFVRRHGAGLAPYVHAAVAAENPNSQALYEDLCADSSAGAAARRHHEERIEFHLWIQWVGREQLHAAHSNALATGMRIGVVHTMVEGLDAHSIADLGAFGGGVFLAHIEADGFDEAVVAARDAGMVVFAEGHTQAERELLVEAGVTPRTTLRSEYDDDVPRDLSDLPPRSMVSVARTQDVPTAAYLAEEHIDLLDRMGMLTQPYEQVRRVERIKRTRLLAKVREAGFIQEDATERQLIEGLHQYLSLTPAQFITATLGDGVGDRRPLALGGTYPDWTYPYTDGAGAGVLGDELTTNARFNSFLEAIDTQLRVAHE